MAHYPDFDAFARLAQTHSAVPVYRRLVSDALTPVSAFHNLDTGGPACLFESVIGGEKVGRYSIVATDPHLQLSASGESLTIRDASGTRTESCADPLRELQDRVERVRAASIADLPPFTGGAIGYAGYDVARYSERLPHPPLDDRRLPDLSFGFFDQLVVFDNVQKTMFVIALAHVGDADSARSAYDAACGRVDRIAERLAARHDGLAPADIAVEGPPRIAYTSNFERTDFEKAVERCVEYIRAGDIFQVVLSQRLAVDLTADPFELYRTLRVVNPSPVMGSSGAPATVRLWEALPRSCAAWSTAELPFGLSREPDRAARRRTTTNGSPMNCSPTPRSGPNTSCSSISGATTWAASPNTARSS